MKRKFILMLSRIWLGFGTFLSKIIQEADYVPTQWGDNHSGIIKKFILQEFKTFKKEDISYYE